MFASKTVVSKYLIKILICLGAIKSTLTAIAMFLLLWVVGVVMNAENDSRVGANIERCERRQVDTKMRLERQPFKTTGMSASNVPSVHRSGT